MKVIVPINLHVCVTYKLIIKLTLFPTAFIFVFPVAIKITFERRPIILQLLIGFTTLSRHLLNLDLQRIHFIKDTLWHLYPIHV